MVSEYSQRHVGTEAEQTMIESNGSFGSPLASIRRVRRYLREQEIYGQHDPTDTWYRVATGLVRQYLVDSNGRRQIVDIYLPGDYFGFTSIHHHRFCAQSVYDGTTVECYSREKLIGLAGTRPEIAQEIQQRAFEAIDRLQEQIIIVGTMTARERVRAFLLYFCERLATAQQKETALPISRYDIGDLLGMSPETVCRAFTELKQRGEISLHGPRRVRMRRPDKSARPADRRDGKATFPAKRAAAAHETDDGQRGRARMGTQRLP